MYSILISKFNEGFSFIEKKLKELINKNSNVVIIPWSFATELKSKNINEFFDEKKKKNYLVPLYEIGVNKKHIYILDCYNDTKEYMINLINKSDIIVLTGGNPEMLYKKIIESKIKNTLKNYKKFAWYDGIGIIDNKFYFDVHSTNKGRYLPSLKAKSIKLNTTIYCLFDTGTIIYNINSNRIECFGKYIVFDGKNLFYTT